MQFLGAQQPHQLLSQCGKPLLEQRVESSQALKMPQLPARSRQPRRQQPRCASRLGSVARLALKIVAAAHEGPRAWLHCSLLSAKAPAKRRATAAAADEQEEKEADDKVAAAVKDKSAARAAVKLVGRVKVAEQLGKAASLAPM